MTVVVALGLVTAWSVLIPGFMDWDDMVLAVIGSLRLTGPVAAAFAAWVAVRRHRADRGTILTPWRAVRAPLGILLVVTGSFGATVLVLGLRAALAEQPGRLLPGGLAMCVAGLALYVMVGWIVGWLLPLAVTPLVAGIGTYGLFTWLATGSTWTDRLTPATREPYDLFTGLSEAAFADQTLWLMGLSTALLLGWVALVTRRTLALAAAAIAVLAAGTGAARLVGGPHTVAASERLAYSCQDWPISVCVHPTLRGGLSELAGVFTTLAARLAGTPAAFTRVEQRGRDDDRVPPGVVAIHIDDLTAGYAQRAAAEFLDRLARPCPGTIAAGYRAIVVAWLRGDPLPAGPLPEHRYAAVWFSGLTEAQRRDWLRMFYSDFVSCRLQGRHFGGDSRPAGPNVTGYPANPPAYPVNPSPGYSLAPSAAPPTPGGLPGSGQHGGPGYQQGGGPTPAPGTATSPGATAPAVPGAPRAPSWRPSRDPFGDLGGWPHGPSRAGQHGAKRHGGAGAPHDQGSSAEQGVRDGLGWPRRPRHGTGGPTGPTGPTAGTASSGPPRPGARGEPRPGLRGGPPSNGSPHGGSARGGPARGGSAPGGSDRGGALPGAWSRGGSARDGSPRQDARQGTEPPRHAEPPRDASGVLPGGTDLLDGLGAPAVTR